MLRLSRVKVKRMFHYLSTTPLLPLGCSPAQSKLETCRRFRVLRAIGPRQATFFGLGTTLGTPFAVLVLRARSATFLRIPYAFLTHSLRRSHDFLACPLLT